MPLILEEHTMDKYTLSTGPEGLTLKKDPNGFSIEQIQKRMLPHMSITQILNLLIK